MKTYKRIMISILSFILILSALPFNVNAAQVPKPPKVSASAGLNYVNLKWTKSKNAAGYIIYQYNAKKKKFVCVKKLNKASFKVTKLSAGTTYKYKLKAYNKKKKLSKDSNTVTVSTLPAAVKNFKVSNITVDSVKLSWSKVSGANKYRLQYSTSSTFKSDVKSVETAANTYTVKGLKSNTKYYFKISAVRIFNKKNLYSAAVVINATTQKPVDISSSVDLNTKYQTIDGFGTSAAWWAHKVGGWGSAEKIIKYLYDREDGIGLNIYRYNVGAGSRPDENIDSYWARTDTFVDSYDAETKTFTYDFTRDAEAQNCLSIAKNLYGDDLRVSLFANSPPVQITDNGKAYVSHHDEWYYKDMPSNLSYENYPVYAKFMDDVAAHFVSDGYRVCDVSPVNEPQYSWCCGENGKMNQEGCHYTPVQAKQLYSAFVNEFDGKEYKVSMFESGAAEGETTIFDDYLMTIMESAANNRYFKSVSTHSYWTTKETKKNCYDYLQKYFENMSVACTEYCQMTNDGNTGVYDISSPIEWWDPARNGLDIVYGVQMARVINEDMTVLNATEWNWWLGVSNGYYPDGLVYIDHEDNDKEFVETSKRLWCLGNYSKFISEGAVRVKTAEVQNDVISSAYKNPDGSLVIVYVNQTKSNKKVKPAVSGNDSEFDTISVYETSADKDLERVNSGVFTGKNEISLKSNSVVSVILTK